MRMIILMALLVLSPTLTNAQTHQPADTNTLSCPPGYALSIDAPAPPIDDPAEPETYAPKSAVEKQKIESQQTAIEMSHWHCVSLDKVSP